MKATGKDGRFFERTWEKCAGGVTFVMFEKHEPGARRVGTTLAELVATGETPKLIAPFALERFHTDTLVSELAAAAVSH